MAAPSHAVREVDQADSTTLSYWKQRIESVLAAQVPRHHVEYGTLQVYSVHHSDDFRRAHADLRERIGQNQDKSLLYGRVHQATGCQVLHGLLRQEKPVYCATADPSCHLCLLLRTGTIPKIEGSMGTFSYLHHTLENAMKPQSMGLLNQGVRVILTAEVTLGVAQQYSKYEGFVAAKDGHNVAVRNIGTNNARYAVYDDKAIFVKEIVLYSPVKEERTPTPPTPDEATPHRPWGKPFTGGFGGTRKDGQPGW